ncbi:MAG: hypothetical protein JWM34_3512 [Ilumatobacteraceae bacterium]|nr:hypothetical protein [Ilumatobacteraceae bacterium]
MKRRTSVLVALGLLAAAAPLSNLEPVHAANGSGTQVAMGTIISPPASLSTTGDYATDTFSDPWDMSNQEDVEPFTGVGAFYSDSASMSDGILNVSTRGGAEIRLVMNWSQPLSVLPWGRDGWLHPIDADKYNKADFRIRADVLPGQAFQQFYLRFWRPDGTYGAYPFQVTSDWQNVHIDLTTPREVPWSGPIVRMEILRPGLPTDPSVNVQLDWFRLHTATSSNTPPDGLPIPRVLTPNVSSGADYATVENGNPWDYHGLDDVAVSNDVANLAINSDGDLTGTSVGIDSYIGLPLTKPLDTDKYHHLTADICYGKSTTTPLDEKGEGMNGRVIWKPHSLGQYVETQDFVVFPGCQTIDLDLVTSPPLAVNDDNTANPTGWRGVRIDNLRFDLLEDTHARDFTVKNIRLTDDDAFSSTYPITFTDTASMPGDTADIYVTTTRGDFSGTRIKAGIPVANGVNTYTWDGTSDTGATLPNGTYWVYVVMHNAAGNAVNQSTGPVRIEKPISSAPSYYVPLTPYRLLDTRNGTGGNQWPIDTDSFTELPVTGVGGVPLDGVTAVVMNVTATDPTGDGYITAWPSGEDRPVVSNINFSPGQTVPNLVTVKVGANGRVNLYNSAGTTNLIADISGYYTTVPPASGGRFTAVNPSRILDTRDGTGGRLGSLGLNEKINLTVTGVGGVPATGVSAVALNVTVDQPTGTGYLTVWPAGEAQPTASTHNFVPGLTVANMVIAKVGAGGQVSIFNSSGNTHVIADVIGYFSDAGGLFVPVVPKRLVDTRIPLGGFGPLGQQDTHTITVGDGSPVPATAQAVVGNVTSVDSTLQGYVTVWPTGVDRPTASTLNPRPGAAVPNQAYLRLGAGGKLDAFNANGSTDLIFDVFGYVVASK